MRGKDIGPLQKAMRLPNPAKLSKLRRTPEYIVAIGLEREILLSEEVSQDQKTKSKDE